MSQPDKVPGRNEPCHCGSGQKYKQCCLDKDETKLRKARAKEAKKEVKATAKKEPDSQPEGTKAAGSSPGSPAVPHKPPQGKSSQPWKRAGGGAHPVQRKGTTHRKVGGK